jgi:tRNA (adenine37-N6)-methyltransferase
VEGSIEILPEFREGLKDLEGFSHLFLIYHFHEAGPPQLSVRPFLDTIERGIFSTRPRTGQTPSVSPSLNSFPSRI